MKIIIFKVIALLLFPAVLNAKQILYVAGMESTKKIYDKLVKEKGGVPTEITDFNSDHASRPVLALLMIIQALHAGGMEDIEIEFLPYPNLSRSIYELKKGKAHILATDMWEDQFDDKVYKSAPFIRKGEFEKGIYTYHGSSLLESHPTIADLSKLKPITGLSWKSDIALLEIIGFNDIETAPTYSLLFKMLAKKRADFALLEFPRYALPHYWANETLYPVNDIKITFPYSRHFMISKTHPEGERVYRTLEKGLKILRKEGRINKALRQSGFFCSTAENWKTIWPTSNRTQDR